MPLTLSQATAADIPALTDIYMLAFQDPITVACFPRTPNVRRWWDSRNTEAFMGDPATRFIKVNDGDRIVAYAKWNVPVRADEPGAASRSSSSSSNPDALPLWPDDANKALCDRFFSELRDKRKEVMRDRPHYYLETLATLLEHRDRNAASLLIRWGLDRADRDGFEAYVEASLVGAPIYEQFGWVTSGQVVTLEGQYTELCMRRSPRPVRHAVGV
ncbi:MAG: hypothetical protein LQ347_004332 [Umbilicaria vellea]|nr:MAG: hypothetical protein LQ347_004332 [Umbilicaria vellea]